jgi:polar amino acid transport system permease protein
LRYHFDFLAVLEYWPLLVRGAVLTLVLTFIAIVLGTVVGVAGAYIRSARVPILSAVVAAYVELIRNTPFIIQLFFVFFGLPSLGLKISAVEAALLAMTLNLGAYAVEIVRAGIESIGRGQIEAGEALGMTRFQIFLHVVLLPALRNVYPSLVSQFVILMLGSSVASQISAEELTFAGNFIQSRDFRSFEVYFIISAIYLVFAFALRRAFGVVGRFAFARR